MLGREVLAQLAAVSLPPWPDGWSMFGPHQPGRLASRRKRWRRREAWGLRRGLTEERSCWLSTLVLGQACCQLERDFPSQNRTFTSLWRLGSQFAPQGSTLSRRYLSLPEQPLSQNTIVTENLLILSFLHQTSILGGLCKLINTANVVCAQFVVFRFICCPGDKRKKSNYYFHTLQFYRLIYVVYLFDNSNLGSPGPVILTMLHSSSGH